VKRLLVNADPTPRLDAISLESSKDVYISGRLHSDDQIFLISFMTTLLEQTIPEVKKWEYVKAEP